MFFFFTKAGKKGDWLDWYQGVINQTNHLAHPSAISKEKNVKRWLIVFWLLCFRGLRKLMFQYFTFGVGEYYRGIVKSAQVKQLQRYVPSLKVEDVERWGTLWCVSIKMNIRLKVLLRSNLGICFWLHISKMYVKVTYRAKFGVQIWSGSVFICTAIFVNVLPPLLDSKNDRE